MGTLGWLDAADEVSSVVGAIAGVLSLQQTWRLLKGQRSQRVRRRSRRWLLLSAGMGSLAVIAGGTVLVAGAGGWPTPEYA